jgi:4-nitrophenyl phosphatase
MGAGLPGSISADTSKLLREIQGLILDVDGVLFEGQRLLPGAAELAAFLRQNQTPFMFLSNNTTYPLEHHIEKLSRLGSPVSPASIITAAQLTAEVLSREAKPGTCCLVIGESGLRQALEAAGFEITSSDYHRAQYVVIGMDRGLTYEKLKCASLAIRNGAQFISSNPDPTYPNGDQLLPASGAIQAALEATTGVRARVTGKPAVYGFQQALARLGTSPQETAMLGDQLEIDVQGAVNAGIRSFLILSSLTPAYRSQEVKFQPDAIFNNILDFFEHWVQMTCESSPPNLGFLTTSIN